MENDLRGERFESCFAAIFGRGNVNRSEIEGLPVAVAQCFGQFSQFDVNPALRAGSVVNQNSVTVLKALNVDGADFGFRTLELGQYDFDAAVVEKISEGLNCFLIFNFMDLVKSSDIIQNLTVRHITVV